MFAQKALPYFILRICRLWYHFVAIGKPYHPHGPMNFLTDPPFHGHGYPKVFFFFFFFFFFASPKCVLTDFNGQVRMNRRYSKFLHGICAKMGKSQIFCK